MIHSLDCGWKVCICWNIFKFWILLNVKFRSKNSLFVWVENFKVEISCDLNKSHEYLKSTTRPGLYNDIIDLFTDVYFDSPNTEQINLMAEVGTGIFSFFYFF